MSNVEKAKDLIKKEKLAEKIHKLYAPNDKNCSYTDLDIECVKIVLAALEKPEGTEFNFHRYKVSSTGMVYLNIEGDLCIYEKVKAEIDRLTAENESQRGLIREFILANPDCCWRKCWSCGKKQIHRESVTPGVLCRFCGSQDTRLLKDETIVLKGKK